MTCLSVLPNELLLIISAYITDSDIISLIQCDKLCNKKQIEVLYSTIKLHNKTTEILYKVAKLVYQYPFLGRRTTKVDVKCGPDQPQQDWLPEMDENNVIIDMITKLLPNDQNGEDTGDIKGAQARWRNAFFSKHNATASAAYIVASSLGARSMCLNVANFSGESSFMKLLYGKLAIEDSHGKSPMPCLTNLLVNLGLEPESKPLDIMLPTTLQHLELHIDSDSEELQLNVQKSKPSSPKNLISFLGIPESQSVVFHSTTDTHLRDIPFSTKPFSASGQLPKLEELHLLFKHIKLGLPYHHILNKIAFLCPNLKVLTMDIGSIHTRNGPLNFEMPDLTKLNTVNTIAVHQHFLPTRGNMTSFEDLTELIPESVETLTILGLSSRDKDRIVAAQHANVAGLMLTPPNLKCLRLVFDRESADYTAIHEEFHKVHKAFECLVGDLRSIGSFFSLEVYSRYTVEQKKTNTFHLRC